MDPRVTCTTESSAVSPTDVPPRIAPSTACCVAVSQLGPDVAGAPNRPNHNVVQHGCGGGANHPHALDNADGGIAYHRAGSASPRFPVACRVPDDCILGQVAGFPTHGTGAPEGIRGLSHNTVSRIWRAFGLQPHRTEAFKLSSDPCFIEKVRGHRGSLSWGLYLARRIGPAGSSAGAVRGTRSPQIQALDRPPQADPLLPMRPGQVETAAPMITCATARYGVALCRPGRPKTGKVIGRCHQRHRAVEFRKFLDTIESEAPSGPGRSPHRGQLRHPQDGVDPEPAGPTWPAFANELWIHDTSIAVRVVLPTLSLSALAMVDQITLAARSSPKSRTVRPSSPHRISTLCSPRPRRRSGRCHGVLSVDKEARTRVFQWAGAGMVHLGRRTPSLPGAAIPPPAAASEPAL